MNLGLLPGPAHDTIASILKAQDFARISATARWLSALYLPEQRSIRLHKQRHDGTTPPGSTVVSQAHVLSLLAKRPGLTKLAVTRNGPVDAVIQALAGLLRPWPLGRLWLLPNLQELELDSMTRETLSTLGQALGIRTWAGWSGLSSLTLRGELGGELGHVLFSGACQSLQRLEVGPDESRTSQVNNHDMTLAAIASYLAATRAPQLQHLAIRIGGPCASSHALVASLTPQGLLVAPSLRYLCLERVWLGGSSVELLADALGRGVWKDLSTLYLEYAHLRSQDMEILMGGLRRGGGYPGLTCLGFSGNLLGNEGAESVARALKEKACPNVVSLDLYNCGIGDEGMHALAGVLTREGCPRLLHLFLGANPAASGGFLRLVEVLKGKAGEELTWLDLSGVGMGQDGAIALVRAFGQGACPRLGILNLSHNDMGDAGLTSLAGALTSGALPALRYLGLESVGAGEKGGSALAQALQHGACPRLHQVVFTYNWGDKSSMGNNGAPTESV